MAKPEVRAYNLKDQKVRMNQRAYRFLAEEQRAVWRGLTMSRKCGLTIENLVEINIHKNHKRIATAVRLTLRKIPCPQGRRFC